MRARPRRDPSDRGGRRACACARRLAVMRRLLLSLADVNTAVARSMGKSWTISRGLILLDRVYSNGLRDEKGHRAHRAASSAQS